MNATHADSRLTGAFVFLFGLAGLAIWAASVSADEVSAAPMNVVLITISSLRADHVGCLGYKRQTTPNFDRFASEGILFRRAFATSGWMMPAHGSIFTSLYPSTHGATHINRQLGGQHLTLAELLAERGYYCAGICCGPRLDREYGFAQGFHLFDDYSVSLVLRGLELDQDAPFDINTRRTNDLINDAATAWLQRNKHRPFFLFLHYYDNHWDYLPPRPYQDMYDPNYAGPIDGTRIAREPLFSNRPADADVRHIVALYDGEVRQTDEDLGEMLRVLRQQGFFKDTIILVLGDHGEQFYEHGNTSHHGLYEELIHIPLAISIPGQVPGKVVDALVSQIDLVPTILDYLGIAVPTVCRGTSVRPLLEGRAERVNDVIYAEYTGGAVPDVFAIRSSRYKCFQWSTGELLAHDLVNDPLEQRPIAPDRWTGELKTMGDALRDWTQALLANRTEAGQ